MVGEAYLDICEVERRREPSSPPLRRGEAETEAAEPLRRIEPAAAFRGSMDTPGIREYDVATTEIKVFCNNLQEVDHVKC